ncbi:hypothetical protein L0Z13_13050 [Burkholderia multivorans]|uniref:hypothetical protein n=1 Tax=Burkholderia multivorans TaxID=87883 RepID=UPI000277C708|nr:hypothetical protein [Burkholderia multivorans]AJY17792.1 hypothetical protein NP80_1432 [Burkholderia multivorans ATCC BAA-247]AVR21825.1 hypothetical protein A8H40_20770 [Burkholderia multivorans]EJO63220.1 hypothetical protein BURMUCF1_1167 [Burkholderia multivorans ATCC BAA-247]MBU9498291.1 hypothetical protein [Burkholderia multivorans]MCO1435173.1 hypothetical protein [Burkholderia multivorans]
MDSSTKAAISDATRAAILADQIKRLQRKLDQSRREVVAEAKALGIEIAIIGSVIVRPKKPQAYYEAIRKGLAFIVNPALDGMSRSAIRDAVATHAGFAAVGIGPKAWSSTKLPPRLIRYAESCLIEAGLMADADRWNGRGKPRFDTFSKVAKFRLSARKAAGETGQDFAAGRFAFLGNDQVDWFGSVRTLRRKGNGGTLVVRSGGRDHGVVAALQALDKTLTKETILGWLRNADKAVRVARERAEVRAAAEAADRAAADELDAALGDIRGY